MMTFAFYLFAISACIAGFMVVIGIVMFATMALLPPMLQHLLGYSVIDTGMALMPRGVGTLISMQLAGLLDEDTFLLVSSDFTHYGHAYGYVPFGEDVPAALEYRTGLWDLRFPIRRSTIFVRHH